MMATRLTHAHTQSRAPNAQKKRGRTLPDPEHQIIIPLRLVVGRRYIPEFKVTKCDLPPSLLLEWLFLHFGPLLQIDGQRGIDEIPNQPTKTTG
jgi:hypothetical protein